MVAEEDDDVVVVGRWRIAGSSRQIFCDTTSYQFYDTIPAYVLVLKYTNSKSGGSWRREHFAYPKLKNICSPLKSKPKRYDTQKYIPTLGTKSVPKPYVESVPIRTQSWTKYFWTNFGYTLCTKGIPMYKSGSGHTSSCHIFCHASHEDHKHNKKYYHRDHGSHCPTSIMQRHHHISATAGPNPLKINDDKVDSLFYNSF